MCECPDQPRARVAAGQTCVKKKKVVIHNKLRGNEIKLVSQLWFIIVNIKKIWAYL